MSEKPLLTKWRLVLHAVPDHRLTGSDLRVLVAILNRINKETGNAHPGFSRIATDAGVSRRAVNYSVNRLAELGYLIRTRREKLQSNLYAIGTPSEPECASESGCAGVANQSARGWRKDVREGSEPGCAQTQSEPNKGTQTPNPDAQARRFDDFWTAYPRKEGKQRALKYWKRQKLDSEADAIIADVKARLSDPGQWKGKKQKHIPFGSTYVHERRWGDEWQPEAGSGRLEREDPDEAEQANAEAAKEAERLWQS